MITYKEIKQSGGFNYWYGDNLVSMKKVLTKADTIIEEDNVEVFYMKNMFLNSKDVELYLFCKDDRIFKLSTDKEFIITALLDKNNIAKVDIKEKYRDSREKMLEIKFKDNEVFMFDSKNDTNEDYSSDLASSIEHIFKYLSLCK
ncbi:MAG: DUF3908 domain-containing protein [Clostridiaceae bacterium]|nr:DUF3908 domain-containing protein [Clostridiaceae bacterium]